jgi:hypothetical protein
MNTTTLSSVIDLISNFLIFSVIKYYITKYK